MIMGVTLFGKFNPLLYCSKKIGIYSGELFTPIQIKHHHSGSRKATVSGIPGELDEGKTNSHEYNMTNGTDVAEWIKLL